jgi:hypothetical protein
VSCFIASFVAVLAGECVGVTTDLAAERRVFLLTGILQASFFLSDRVFVLTIWNFEVVFLGDLEEILLFLCAIFRFFTVTGDGFLSLALVASESEASSNDVELDSISALRS